jgi:hypothetical protein
MESRCRDGSRAVTVLCWLFAAATSAFAQTSDINVSSADQIWEGVQPGVRAGTWLDSGALSIGDARRDLVIGAPGGPSLFGTVHVIYGGPVRSGTLSLNRADLIITGEAQGDLFGTSTAAGNILTNDDIPRALAVGAPNALGGRGVVYLFAGPFGNGVSLSASQAVFRVIGTTGDRIGTMLATADLDGDGFREIVIGAPGNQRVYVIKGGPALSGTQDLSVTPAARTIAQPGIGSVLAAGDVTGDNVHDLLIGAPLTNGVYLYTGAVGTIPSSPAAIFVGLNSGDLTGASVRLADVDSDGNRDILIGAPGGDGPDDTRIDAGEVYLIWGGVPLTSRNMFAADVTFYGLPGERLGASMTSGDINRDSPDDVAMLAESAAGGAGILYVYYGRARSRIGTLMPDGHRRVDFTAPGQISRRIGSDSAHGPIVAVETFEVTGEGARDVIVGIPSGNSSRGTVYFTLSPKMRVSRTLSMFADSGATTTAALPILNPTAISITWEMTSNRPWLSVSPASGSSVNEAPGMPTVTAAAASMPPGTYTGTLTLRSTSPDLLMSVGIAVTLTITQTTVSVDIPVNAAVVRQPFSIAGWALDFGATADSGVDAIHVWGFPTNGAPPVFFGVAPYGGSRGDVGAAFGTIFTNSGFNLQVTGVRPGTYQVAVYAHNKRSGAFSAPAVRFVTILSSAAMNLDTPLNGAVTNGSFQVAGWAFDAGASTGTGVDAIHVWAFPANGAAPVFLGVATYGDSRPDVGAVFATRFTNSGFHLNVTNLAPGAYTVAVYAHSSVSGTFDNSRAIGLSVLPSQRMALDLPANGASVNRPFQVAGWALDLAAATGTGVDTMHVWATPTNGGAAVFLGVATYGTARPDVGAVFGARFTNSGFTLNATVAPGTYTISVYAHSTVANAFNNIATAVVTVR